MLPFSCALLICMNLKDVEKKTLFRSYPIPNLKNEHEETYQSGPFTSNPSAECTWKYETVVQHQSRESYNVDSEWLWRVMKSFRPLWMGTQSSPLKPALVSVDTHETMAEYIYFGESDHPKSKPKSQQTKLSEGLCWKIPFTADVITFR
ncbi:hypothetical protein Ocin01_03222 [Orchesella cincta]|uniref:Uncharacterized protein n=1 Tax=Orchesella cincta TaxID=48709 RepID=A0A1D2NDZ7_ORCCI|nr:hypothetical protein Ocin01_03222 [Orchesella cincta]